MNHSTPGLPVHHHLQEFTKTCVQRVGGAIETSHPLSSPSPPAPNPSSFRVFSNESTLHMRRPKYWSFSFSISPFNEHPGLISLSHKNKILPFAATWMDLENIILTKVSQTGRQIFYAVTYMWNVKNNTNQYIYKKLKDSQT